MADSSQYGAFIPTTTVFDISLIYQIDVNTTDFKDLLVRLYQTVNAIALNTNIKDAGLYPLAEFINGQLYFPNPSLSSATEVTPTLRQVWRKVINWGKPLPGGPGPIGGSGTVAHEIPFNDAFSTTRIYGSATDPVGLNYIPLPYASPVAGDEIALSVDANNVIITTGSNRSNFTIAYIVIEYLKN